MTRILVLDTIAQEGLDLLDKAPGVEYEVKTGLKGEDLRKALSEADGAVCRSGVKITEDILRGLPRLKAIVRAGVGVDNIDVRAAMMENIVVMNTPSGNTVSTAEHTMTLMLAMCRHVAPAYQELLQGVWNRKYMGTQLSEKVLGIVGLGRIGREVAKRAKAFDMRVLGYDPFLSAEYARELGIEKVEKVEDMLPQVDFLTVHTPLSDQTKYLVNQQNLHLLKDGVRLINCARGGIYEEAALVKGLESGKIAGVALDVFESEPVTSHPLFGKKGVVCTPHLGASTNEAQTSVAVEGVQLLIDFLTRGQIKHAVNVVLTNPDALEDLRGELDLIYRMGLFLNQWTRNQGVSQCRLHFRGEIAGKDVRLLTGSFCVGMLAGAMDDVHINNAEALLADRGVQLSVETRKDPSAFRSSIGVEIEADGKIYKIGGALFGQDPRIIRIQDYFLEAYLDGTLLVFYHLDRPGIIGKIGTLMGQNDVNIKQMAVGPLSDLPGAEAIGVLQLDKLPEGVTLASLEKQAERLEGIHEGGVRIFVLPERGQLPPFVANLQAYKR